jgi:hypothetical protein
MDIAAFISELLEHQNELMVPGLGSFYRSPVEGYYNKEQQQFYPPTLQLQFNAGLKEDDGKLVELIAADKHITAASAQYFVDKFVTDLLAQLNNGSVSLDELGTFSMSRDQVVFTAKKLTNNNELYYGLAPVKLKRNKAFNEEGVEKPIVHVPVTEKPSAFTAALLRGEPMPSAPVKEDVELEEYEDTDDSPRKFSTWILVAALIILISGIALIGAYKYDPSLFDRFRSENDPPPLSDTKIKRLVSDSIEHAIQAQKDIGATPVVDSATKSKIEAPETPVDTFAIVIGTFNTLNGATREYDRYTNKGLNVEIRKKPDGTKRYQIDIAAYYKIDSAKAHLNEFKNRLQEPEIFIETYPYKKQ